MIAAEPFPPALPLPASPDYPTIQAVALPELAGAVPLGLNLIGSKAARFEAPRQMIAAEPFAPALPVPAFPDHGVIQVGAVQAVALPELAGAVPLLGSKTQGDQIARPIHAAAENVQVLASAATPAHLLVSFALPQRQPSLAIAKKSGVPSSNAAAPSARK